MAILTISREFGSGGREIGYNISRLLNYEYIDKEKIFSDIRADGKKWEEWGKTLDEHRPSIWEKYDWSFQAWGALIQSHIFEYALKNNVVIMGRGGNFLLKGIPYALRIRVTAPIEMRIKRITRRDSADEKTAKWLAEKTDKERAGFINALYGKDLNEPSQYDMVFDTGAKSIEEITDIIRNALLEKDKLVTEDAKKNLLMRAQAAKVKAGILTDSSFFVPTLEVYPEGEGLILRAVIHGTKEHKRVEEKAIELAGDVPIKCELHYRG